jgi:hypothetical protein
MRVDLKAIAQADPGGELDVAYASMSTELLPVTYRTLTGNDLRIWAASNPTSYENIKTTAATNVAAEVAELLIQTPDSVLELGKPQVLGLVEDLASSGVIEVSGKDALLEMAEVQALKWPQLKAGHLATARRQTAIANADPRSGLEPDNVAEKDPSYDAYKAEFDIYINSVKADVDAINVANAYPNLSVSELRDIRKKRDQGRI